MRKSNIPGRKLPYLATHNNTSVVEELVCGVTPVTFYRVMKAYEKSEVAIADS
jgi:hypothetical protein